MRFSIKLSSFMFFSLSIMLIFQCIISNQLVFPFGTNCSFELETTNSNITKDAFISDLNLLTDNNNGILVKVITNIENYENGKDVIYFGSTKPSTKELVVVENEIKWLSSELEGELLNSKDMGSTPISGEYAFKGSDLFQEQLTEFCEKHGMTIRWYEAPSLISYLYNIIIHTGIGNAVITAFILLVTTIVSYFIQSYKKRSIRLIGGIVPQKINVQDTFTIIKDLGCMAVLTLFVFSIYIAFTKNMHYMSFLIYYLLIMLIMLIILLTTIIYGISVITQPKICLLASRKIPLKRFSILEKSARSISIVLALLIIPSTINSAYIVSQLSTEYSLWTKMNTNISVSLSNLDELESDEMLPQVDNFFDNMDEENNLLLSYAIDKSILLSEEEYGGYDHIIITNKNWVDSIEVGINEHGSSGMLSEIEFQQLEAPLQNFLYSQVPLWTNSGNMAIDNITYHEFDGDVFLALSPNVGYGGSTIQAKNPLVILVDTVSETMKSKGFTLYAMSSGNVVFNDQPTVEKALSDFNMSEYVISIDTIVDVALSQAQKFASEALYYGISCFLILIVVMLTGVISAKLWVSANKKKIFALHTAGISYYSILSPILIKETIHTVLLIIFSAFISYLLRYTNIALIIMVAGLTLLIYGSASIVTYLQFTNKEFNDLSNRRM